jgi:methylated-DNA-[protein]-cysteine S-methyltransferase
MHRTHVIASPLGSISIRGTESFITNIAFADDHESSDTDPHEVLLQCADQLLEYFEGSRTSFVSLPLSIEKKSFTDSVWQAMKEVPYGNILTYRGLAHAAGKPAAVRAVGSACRKNPFIIVIPCHRIIPSSFELGNYAGGIERKEWLQNHEERISTQLWTNDIYSELMTEKP